MKTNSVKHPFGEVAFWTWAAAAVVLVSVLASFFTVREPARVADNSTPIEHNATPPLGYPTVPDH